MTKKLWFKAKRYGYGWTPCTWQGWLCIALYVAFLVYDVQKYSHVTRGVPGAFLVHVFIATAVLIFVSWYKGEKASWRWGNS
jgi:hypothetical protein